MAWRFSLEAPHRAIDDIHRYNVVFKLNAGRNIGNYNLARCRQVTDGSGRVWLEALGLSDLREDSELEHALIVRTPFEDEGDE